MSAPTPKITEEKEPFIAYVPEEKYPESLIAALGPYKDRMGFVPNALKLYMHRPEISETLWALNNKVMRDPSSTLDQFLKRKLAAVASKINGCTYCTSHNCATLQNTAVEGLEGWGLADEEITQLLQDPQPANEMEEACFEYIKAASFDPTNVPEEILVNLKNHLTPPQIIELACVAGFWKMYNTIHDSLNIPLEKHLLGTSGYVDV